MLVIAMPILPATALGQIEWKDRYVTLAENDQRNHSIALPTREGYTVVVWEDERPGSNGSDIYAQKIDNATGLALWSPIDGVPICTEEGDQRLPRAAFDTLDGVIVVWEDYRDAYTQNGTAWNVKIYGHRIDLSNGTLDQTWSSSPDGVVVAAYTNGNAQAPRITCTGSGAYIAWTDFRNASYHTGAYHNSDVYLTYFESATAAPPPQNCSGVASYAQHGNPVTLDTNDQRNPELALDNLRRVYCLTVGGGQQTVHQLGATVVFEDNRNGNGGLGIAVWNLYAHAFGIDGRTIHATFGVAMQNELRISPSEYDQLNHRLAATGGVPSSINAGSAPSWGVVVVWEDLRDDPQQQNQVADVYAQLVQPESAPYLGWQSALNLTNSSAEQRAPCLAVFDGPTDETRAYVAWQDARNTGSTDLDVYAEAIEVAYGTAVNPSSGLAVSAVAGDQAVPAIDILYEVDSHYPVIAWEDERSASGIDIYCQVFDPDLSGYRRTQNGDPVTAAKNDQTRVFVNRDVFVWQDERREAIAYDSRSDANIYAQKLGDECDGSGLLRWREVYAKWTDANDAANHRMVTDSSGASYMVWNEARPVGEYTETQKVYAQKFDKDGVPRWTNGGMLLSDPALDATHPDLSIDGLGGVFVTWQQTENGQQNFEIAVKRISAPGIIKSIWKSSGSVARQPVASVDAMMDDYDGFVTFACRAYVAFIVGDEIHGHYFDSTGTVGNKFTSSSQDDWEDLKICTDYRRGCWMMYGSSNALRPAHYNQGHITTDDGTESNAFSADQLLGFDIAADVRVVWRFPSQPYTHDLLFAYSKFEGSENQIFVGRTVQTQQSPQILFGNILPSLLLATTGHSTHPAIVADSIPSAVFEGGYIPIGGMMVSWDDEYSSPPLHRVLSNRVHWTFNSNTGIYSAIAQFLDQNNDPDHAVLADSCESQTYPDIVRLNTTIPYPSLLGDPIILRFGATVWQDDRGLGCPPTNAVRLMVADYTDWITNGDNAIALGEIGAVVSPLIGSFVQSAPIIECGRLNSMVVCWGDTRTGTANVIETRLSFDETNKVEAWMKFRQLKANAAADELRLLDAYPHPLVAGHSAAIPYRLGMDAYVTLRVYDNLGRPAASPVGAYTPAGEHVAHLDAAETAVFRPGVYRCVLQAGDRSDTRTVLFIR